MNPILRRSVAACVGLAVAGLSSTAEPLAAQSFGRSVAVAGDQVLVVKPLAGRGPGAVFVYEAGPDGWVETQRLGADITAATGESIGPEIVVSGDVAYIGSADPEVLSAAHMYARGEDGAWSAIGPVPMEPGATETGERPPLDRDGLFAILAPPQRIISADGERIAVGRVANSGGGSVTLMERNPDSGEWSVLAELAPANPDPAGGFGSSVLLSGDRLFVGAPRSDDGTGAVHVFQGTPEGWTETTVIDGETVGDVRRIGSALELDSGVLWIGAPGTGDDEGSVILLRRNADGTWEEVRRLAEPGMERTGNRFGSSIEASGGVMWIGSPGTASGSGNVTAFVASTDGTWRATMMGLDRSTMATGGLGASVSAQGERVAIGAPFADGGVGRVTVLELTGDRWTASTIEPAGALESVAGAEIRCTDGEAGGFPCADVDLLSFLTIESLGGQSGERVSDIWGWSDAETGAEYALVGRTTGVVIVNVTDPANPVVIGTIPANPSGARDIKTYADHMFFTGDGAGDHGLVVFDLARLRSLESVPATLEPDTVYHGMASAHNLAINTESGFAYVVRSSGGGETCGGGLHMVDIRTPRNPQFAGCYTDTEGLLAVGSGHDTQCVNYHGPDANYRDRELCFASNETVMRIVDVTDKSDPQIVGSASYPAQAYIHQGWLTDDHAFFYMDDELDELVGNTERTRTLVWDLTELDDPTYAGELLGPDASTDHNLYIDGDRMYQANYQAGLRVIDISDRTAPVEIGHFDTTPYGANPPGFNGAWTAYPYFDSGTVIVSSMQEGLFVLRPVRPLVP